MCDESGQLRRSDTGLLRFGVDVDLHADVDYVPGGGVQAARDLRPVHGVHPLEVIGDVPGLVGLDGADEVPNNVQVREGGDLGGRFLDVVLTELALSGSTGGSYFRRIPRFRYRKQSRRGRTRASRCYIVRPTRGAGTISRRGQLGENGVYALAVVHAAV